MLTVNNEGSVITILVSLTVQPLLSVTTNPYVAAESPESAAAVPPLLQAYVYGTKPPLTAAVALPSAKPKQLLFCMVIFNPNAGRLPIATLKFERQPRLSITSN